LTKDGEQPVSINMSSPDLTDAERDAVLEVLRTPRLSMGPQIEAFENIVADYIGAEYAVAVSSGTAGLHLCVRAAGITDGDWVITTPFSFISSANVILYERATPVFVDIDSSTGNIDPEQVGQAVQDLLRGGQAAARRLPRKGAQESGRLKAILPVDVFGQPADFDALNAIANENDLVVIEDSCEALGASYKGRPAGMLADAGVFAFYPNKQITTGEGGIIVTQDESWADSFRALRNQGRAPGDTWLDHTHLGYNYRLDEMSAALGRVQMGRLDELLDKRRRVADWYGERLADISGVDAPRIDPNTTRVSWFVYVVRLAGDVDRSALVERLTAAGIPSRPYFVPIHTQPYFIERFEYRPGDFPVTEDLGKRSLALPFSTIMTEGEVDRVCEALQKNING